jgi:hypothetical protein
VTTFGELCCEVCGIKGSVTPMFRANPKGETGRWRCEGCMTSEIPAEVLAVTDDVEFDNLLRREGLR